MKLKLDVYTPQLAPGAELAHPGAVVIAPYAFHNSEDSNRQFMQMTADAAGVAIVGVHRPGASSALALLNPFARHRLNPDYFDDTAATFGGQLRDSPILQGFDHKVGWGDAVAGAWVLGAQKARRPFNSLLLRNCINHKAPEDPNDAAARFFAHYTTQTEVSVSPAQSGKTPARLQNLRDGLHRFAEARINGKLLASEYADWALFGIVTSEPHTPLALVDLSDGPTGSKEQASNHLTAMANHRAQTVARHGGVLLTTEMMPSTFRGLRAQPDVAARQISELLDRVKLKG